MQPTWALGIVQKSLVVWGGTQAAVQFGITTVFGWYAAAVLLYTGHLAPLICLHAFCNGMGVPDVAAVFQHKKRVVVMTVFLMGILGFALTWPYLQDAAVYSNEVDGSDLTRYVSLCSAKLHGCKVSPG